LDAAKIGSQNFRITEEPSEIDTVLRESVESLRPLADQKSLALEAVLGTSGSVCMMDRSRIIQVLSNLIGNAIKFTPIGGRIHVSTHCHEGCAVVSVSDTGPGIPPDMQAHLFERFYQPESTKKQGTGLGLFIAKGIIVAHGGQMSMRSVPPDGCEFSFTLPLMQGKARAANA
jgi:signal transduction histidine kinase